MLSSVYGRGLDCFWNHVVECDFLLIVRLVNAGVASFDCRSGRLRVRQRRAAECPPYHPRLNFAEISFRPAWLLRSAMFNNPECNDAGYYAQTWLGRVMVVS